MISTGLANRKNMLPSLIGFLAIHQKNFWDKIHGISSADQLSDSIAHKDIKSDLACVHAHTWENSMHQISILDQVRMLRILSLKRDLRYSDQSTKNFSDSSIAIAVNKVLNTCKSLQENETIIAQRAGITSAAFLLRQQIAKIERQLTLIKVEIIVNNRLTSIPESINLLVNLRELILETTSLRALPDMSRNAHLKQLKIEVKDVTQLEPASMACIERLEQKWKNFEAAFKTPAMFTFPDLKQYHCERSSESLDNQTKFDEEFNIDPTRMAYLNKFRPRGLFPERRPQ